MRITISTKSKSWTSFEKREWEKADTEHYGEPLKWDKKDFKISAYEGKKMIANLRMDIREGVAYVDAIIVSPEYRGKGVGKELMAKAEEIARKNSAHKLYLQTGKEWSSLAFYLELGYKITSELPNHYHHVDFVEMTKWL